MARAVRWKPALLCSLMLMLMLGAGCSARRYAMNQLADALSHSGTTFARDDDPELVRAAAPFSLKLLESVLAETPEHAGLLVAAAGGFTQYAFAFVQQDADELEEKDLAAAAALRARARRLYLRGRDYGLRSLNSRHPGLTNAFAADPHHAVEAAIKSDVPTLYWTAAAWAAAISLSKDNPEMVAQLPGVEALMDRALVLDESHDRGAIHTFFITYEMSRKSAGGDPVARAQTHFERAVALSDGLDASPFVALAEAVCVQKQDVRQFESLLGRALAINVDTRPENRLSNLIMQHRARWLLARKSDLFLLGSEN